MGCCSSSNNNGASEDPKPGYDNSGGNQETKKDDDEYNGKTGKLRVICDGTEQWATTDTQQFGVTVRNPRVIQAVKAHFRKNKWKSGRWWRLPVTLDAEVITCTNGTYDNTVQPGQEQLPPQQQGNDGAQNSGGGSTYGNGIPTEEEQEIQLITRSLQRSSATTTEDYEVDFVTEIDGVVYGIKEGKISKSSTLKGTTDMSQAATVTFKKEEDSYGLWRVVCNKTIKNDDGTTVNDDFCMGIYWDGFISWSIRESDAIITTAENYEWQVPRFALHFHADVNSGAEQSADHRVIKGRSRYNASQDKFWVKINNDDEWVCTAKNTANRIVSFVLEE